MDTFDVRITLALEKEKSDAARLEGYGCKVYPFGQSLLPVDARMYLRKYPRILPLRWLPDLLVVHPGYLLPGRRVNLDANFSEGVNRAEERNYVYPKIPSPNMREWIWLVDSKTGKQDTANWDLEKSAHDAHCLQRTALGIPIVYIWPDGCTCSYVEDLSGENMIDGPRNRRTGSGTPYWLIPKGLTRPLAEVFGKGKDV